MATTDARLLPGVDARVAVWCAALEPGQAHIFELIGDLGPDALAKVPQGLSNSIAGLAVHVAAAEVRIAQRISGVEVPAGLRAELGLDRPRGPLDRPQGETAQTLRDKAGRARAVLAQALAPLGEADLSRELALGPRTVTVRFALVHLADHQMQHYGHMQIIRQLL